MKNGKEKSWLFFGTIEEIRAKNFFKNQVVFLLKNSVEKLSQKLMRFFPLFFGADFTPFLTAKIKREKPSYLKTRKKHFDEAVSRHIQSLMLVLKLESIRILGQRTR